MNKELYARYTQTLNSYFELEDVVILTMPISIDGLTAVRDETISFAFDKKFREKVEKHIWYPVREITQHSKASWDDALFQAFALVDGREIELGRYMFGLREDQTYEFKSSNSKDLRLENISIRPYKPVVEQIRQLDTEHQFLVQVNFNYKQFQLGLFPTRELAQKALDRVIYKYKITLEGIRPDQNYIDYCTEKEKQRKAESISADILSLANKNNPV